MPILLSFKGWGNGYTPLRYRWLMSHLYLKRLFYLNALAKSLAKLALEDHKFPSNVYLVSMTHHPQRLQSNKNSLELKPRK